MKLVILVAKIRPLNTLAPDQHTCVCRLDNESGSLDQVPCDLTQGGLELRGDDLINSCSHQHHKLVQIAACPLILVWLGGKNDDCLPTSRNAAHLGNFFQMNRRMEEYRQCVSKVQTQVYVCLYRFYTQLRPPPD
jgi:hypothetical protein